MPKCRVEATLLLQAVVHDGQASVSRIHAVPVGRPDPLESIYSGEPDQPDLGVTVNPPAAKSPTGPSTTSNPVPLLEADFVASPTSTDVLSGPVSFSDKSQGKITSWTWNFGDGSMSSLKNPTHHYDEPGSYTVSLHIDGPMGAADERVKTDYITVDAPFGWVFAESKISDTAGGFEGVLDDIDLLGYSSSSLGDLDGDGVSDLAVGARLDDDGGGDRGAVWICLMNANGTVKSEQKISDTSGNFGGMLSNNDTFGTSVTSLGDMDSDGVNDLAVGAPGHEDGAIWVLFLNSDGTVKSEQKISETSGGFTGSVDGTDEFAHAISSGDVDQDGIADLAVGAFRDDDGGGATANRGAVWILLLNANGTVKSTHKISDTAGNFGGILDNGDQFGVSVSFLGDLDEDGVIDLAVGANGDDDGSNNNGAVWILFLNTNGTVKAHQKISETAGGFGGDLQGDSFGWSATPIGDLDGDLVVDAAVGAYIDDDGGSRRGAVWILLLNSDGTVKAEQKISDLVGGFEGFLGNNYRFGSSVTSLGDLNGDGFGELGVGVMNDNDGGFARGAMWILSLYDGM